MHVELEPDFCVPIQDHALPPRDARAAALAMFKSASFLAAFGASTTPSEQDKVTARAVASESVPPSELQTVAAATHLKALLDEFDHQVVQSMTQLRTFVTNRLIEEAAPGRKNSIRALELLGKISGVDLFTERSEITVKHKTTEDLQSTLRAKLAKLSGVHVVEDAVYRPLGDKLPAEPVPAPLADPFEQIDRTLDAIAPRD